MNSAHKILIVDDEPDICYFLSENFTRRGFNTAFAYSLADAEKRLAEDPPSVLLLDNHLPDGKGVDFLESLKPKYPEMKVIMVTAHDSAQDRMKAFENNIDFFISKPFTLTSVNHAVDIILNNK